MFCFQKLPQYAHRIVQCLTSKVFQLFGSLYLDILKTFKDFDRYSISQAVLQKHLTVLQ